MELVRDKTENKFVIDSFDGNNFIIDGESYTAPFAILADKILPFAKGTVFDESLLTSLQITPHTLLLIGTGAIFTPISDKLMYEIYAKKASFEVMSNISAVTTYSVLHADNRQMITLFL